MNWTEAQKEVIKERDKDILVSAAAGSGKTAVLVERIIRRVTDPAAPTDIDHLLVVTFTRAAAAEMRERIFAALAREAEERPDDPHLIRQLSLIHNARITTIDGFCQYVFRNHFHEIGKDPGLRIADEAEMTLLKSEVISRVFERNYERADENFMALVDAFARRERDSAIEDMVLSLYTEACTYPDPKQWLNDCISPYDVNDIPTLLASPWMEVLLRHAKTMMEDIRNELVFLYDELSFAEPDHPYLDTLDRDLISISKLTSQNDYAGMREAFADLEFSALSRKTVRGEDKEFRKQVMERRNRCKKEITSAGEKLFSFTPEEILEQMESLRPRVEVLVNLTLEFMDELAESKLRRGLMDFSDLEHFALEILTDVRTEKPTDTAREYASYFDEIMIDEYQDSNYIQEMILSSIARRDSGKRNYFMVGDVKQSIYRFRQARPDIFTGKYTKFRSSGSDGDERLINLDFNFRSRREVTDSVNTIFTAVMHENVGSVEYDADAALKCRAIYPEVLGDDNRTEIILVEDGGETDQRARLEARAIGLRIRELMKSFMVTDRESGELRPAAYSDIAILHRSANSVGDRYVDELKELGIPAVMATRKGYFQAVEVERILALLTVIDNPRQDIPLAAVLSSPIFGVTEDELAMIRQAQEEGTLYEALISYSEASPQNEKINRFRSFLDRMRILSKIRPIHELLQTIYSETSYPGYVSALPAGSIRRANLEKLLLLSISYEKSSFKGLFHFVRYIKRLREYDQDFGEADEGGPKEDAVSVMTVHKSKGLEFPIVFAAGMAGNFNHNTSRLLLSPRYGAGLFVVNEKRRIRTPSIFRNFLSMTEDIDERGEELRILYVALTRAKEKLIMTGCGTDISEKYMDMPPCGQRMSLNDKLRASCFYDWVIPAAQARPGEFTVREADPAKDTDEAASGAGSCLHSRQDLLVSLKSAARAGADRMRTLSGRIYPHLMESPYKVKYSVSELKRAGAESTLAGEDIPGLFDEKTPELPVPEFIGGRSEVNRASARGTAVHRFMQFFDFSREDYRSSFDEQISQMTSETLLTREQASLIHRGSIERFLGGDVARRMHSASLAGTLHREKAFVMADSAGSLFGDPRASEEEILVQGIIDVYFEEDDGIVVLDYKTDRVRAAEELIKRYSRQLNLYSGALSRVTGRPVTEKLLYSFSLSEEVRI